MQRRLQSLEGAARMFDLVSLEEAGETEARVELGLGIGPLHMEASELLCEVESLAPDADQELHDLLFGIRTQLGATHAGFRAALTRGNTLEVLAAAGRSVGEVIRASRALERLVAERAGTTPSLGRERDTLAALALRQGFAELRREVEQAEDPCLSHLHRATRAITALTEVHRRSLRLSDRIALRRLVEKIEELQRRPVTSVSDDLEQLDADARAVLSLLLEINCREELVEHDRALARQMRGRLSGKGSLSEDLRTALLPLVGRSQRLDELLRGTEPPSAAEVAAELETILAGSF